MSLEDPVCCFYDEPLSLASTVFLIRPVPEKWGASLGLAKENYLLSSSRLGLVFGFSLRPGRAFVLVLPALSSRFWRFHYLLASFYADNIFFWSRLAVVRFLAACGLSPPFVTRGSCNNSICLLRCWFSFLLCVVTVGRLLSAPSAQSTCRVSWAFSVSLVLRSSRTLVL